MCVAINAYKTICHQVVSIRPLANQFKRLSNTVVNTFMKSGPRCNEVNLEL